MMSHNSIGKYNRNLVNWLGTCLGTERRRLQTRLVECRTGKKWMSGAPLFTLVIWSFITLLMFVLNFVLFFNLFTEGRQYFITLLMLVLNFLYKKRISNLTINMQLLYFITTVTSQIHSARHHQRAGYSATYLLHLSDYIYITTV